MRRDDKTTSNKIKKKLERHGICVSASTVRRARKQQGWTLQRTAYCQLIRDANKVKRLEFAQRVLESGDTFNNVIFSDECSISLQAYRRTCFRMVNEPTKWKLKPKHPIKVHVWGGISRSGATKICMFDGIMDADLFCSILETTLVPFISEKLPDHHFKKDNDPKHTSRQAQAFFEEHEINWWRTPPESPDLNRTCGIGSSSTWSPRSSQRTSRSWWTELRSSGRGKSRRKNVTSILTTFCRGLFQLWWRLKEQRQNIKNDRFRCQHALPCRMLIWHCTAGR